MHRFTGQLDGTTYQPQHGGSTWQGPRQFGSRTPIVSSYSPGCERTHVIGDCGHNPHRTSAGLHACQPFREESSNTCAPHELFHTCAPHSAIRAPFESGARAQIMCPVRSRGRGRAQRTSIATSGGACAAGEPASSRRRSRMRHGRQVRSNFWKQGLYLSAGSKRSPGPALCLPHCSMAARMICHIRPDCRTHASCPARPSRMTATASRQRGSCCCARADRMRMLFRSPSLTLTPTLNLTPTPAPSLTLTGP